MTGLDLNQGMLAVAKNRAPGIQWRQGPVEALPYDARSFDAVVSQFGLMFFVDPAAALREMLRVLRPGGRLAVAVWDRLESSPGYAAMADLLQRLFGDGIADALRVPFRLGDPAALHSLCAEAGVPQPRLTTHAGSVRFPSIRSWMYTDIKGWTLSDRLDDAQYEVLLREAEAELRPFVGADGGVAFGASAHIVAATKPQ